MRVYEVASNIWQAPPSAAAAAASATVLLHGRCPPREQELHALGSDG
jgi:hypothetical protein